MATKPDLVKATPAETRALMTMQLARNWWIVALRGVVNIAFGVAFLIEPELAALVMFQYFAAFAVVDGVLEIASAVRAASRQQRWGMLLLSGITSVVAGAAAYAASLILPGAAIFAFLALFAAWAILSGALMIAAAFRMDNTDGRWWLGLSGLLSFLFGVGAAIVPRFAFIAVTAWIGGFAIAFGVFLLILAFRLKARGADKITPAEPAPARTP